MKMIQVWTTIVHQSHESWKNLMYLFDDLTQNVSLDCHFLKEMARSDVAYCCGVYFF